MWVILGKAKKEEVEFSELKFIRDFRVHPSFSVVLSLEQQLDDVVNFCTNPKEFGVFSIDPTFNIFNDNISLTVITYRNLKLENPSIGQALVFLGPLLMHQKKDWKIYSRFANCLVTEKPEISALLACGTDGEKQLLMVLTETFLMQRFAMFHTLQEKYRRAFRKSWIRQRVIEIILR